jgi:hypothetical protein
MAATVVGIAATTDPARLPKLALAMSPVLTWVYVRLAHREEREVSTAFGDRYTRDAATTPAFIPDWRDSFPAGRAPRGVVIDDTGDTNGSRSDGMRHAAYYIEAP